MPRRDCDRRLDVDSGARALRRRRCRAQGAEADGQGGRRRPPRASGAVHRRPVPQPVRRLRDQCGRSGGGDHRARAARRRAPAPGLRRRPERRARRGLEGVLLRSGRRLPQDDVEGADQRDRTRGRRHCAPRLQRRRRKNLRRHRGFSRLPGVAGLDHRRAGIARGPSAGHRLGADPAVDHRGALPQRRLRRARLRQSRRAPRRGHIRRAGGPPHDRGDLPQRLARAGGLDGDGPVLGRLLRRLDGHDRALPVRGRRGPVQLRPADRGRTGPGRAPGDRAQHPVGHAGRAHPRRAADVGARGPGRPLRRRGHCEAAAGGGPRDGLGDR